MPVLLTHMAARGWRSSMCLPAVCLLSVGMVLSLAM